MFKKTFVFLVAALFLPCSAVWSLDLDRLSPEDQARVDTLLTRLDPLLTPKKQDGSMNLLTFPELYDLVPRGDHPFLDQIRSLDPALLGATAHAFSEEKRLHL